MENIISIELENYLEIKNGSITIDIFLNFLEYYTDLNSDFSKWIIKNPTEDPKLIIEKFTSSPLLNESIYTIVKKLQNLFDYAQENNIVSNKIKNYTKVKKIYGGNMYTAEYFCAYVLKFLYSDIEQYGSQANDIYTKTIKYYCIGLYTLEQLYSQYGYSVELLTFAQLIFKYTFFALKKNNRINQYIYDNYKRICKCMVEDFFVILNTLLENIQEGENMKINNTILSMKDFVNYPNLRKSSSVTFINILLSFIDTDVAQNEEIAISCKQTLIEFIGQVYANEYDITNAKEMTEYIENKIMYFRYKTHLNYLNNQKNLYQNMSDKTQEIENKIIELNQQSSDLINNLNMTTSRISNITSIISSLANMRDTTQYNIENKSGTEKPNQRLIFLIITSTSGSYAIKISTNMYIQYAIEGEIYSKMKMIMEDINEPRREMIQNSVLNCYNYSPLQNNNSNKFREYAIKIKNNLIISAKLNLNRNLFDSINNLALQNNTNNLIYYVTENLLGSGWKALVDVNCSNSAKCAIAEKALVILFYLNEKYGFTHWDLHNGNIFVDTNNLANIKIYDFDYSEINSSNPYVQKNNTLINNMKIYSRNPQITNILTEIHNSNNVLRHKYGFIHDVFRVITSFANTSLCTEKVNNIYNIYINTINNAATLLSKAELILSPYINYVIAAYLVVNNADYYNRIMSEFRGLFGGDYYKEKYLMYKKKYLELKRKNIY